MLLPLQLLLYGSHLSITPHVDVYTIMVEDVNPMIPVRKPLIVFTNSSTDQLAV